MKRLAILGAGKSGVGAAILGKKKGWNVFVSDARKISEEQRKVLYKYEITWEEGAHSEIESMNADLVVKSPGIPDNVPIVQSLRRQGIEIISEVELAYRYTKATIIGVTGSNGKTTTSSLCYHILQNCGLEVGLVGNVGKSFAKWVALEEKPYVVVELSSFQLDGIVNFRPHIAILLNITPDHLDRYDYKMENYVASKFKIIQNMGPNDYLIHNKDDVEIGHYLSKHEFNVSQVPFTIEQKLSNGAWLDNENLIIKTKENQLSMSIFDLALQGKHNLYNSMAAGVAARILELRKEVVRESLTDFQAIEHRLERVARVHGIEFINDSKATNVNSTWYALESFNQPIVWIVGGVDKGNDYSQLQDLVSEKVKAIVCLGKDNKKILKSFKNQVNTIVESDSAMDAVKQAYSLAKSGDVVLLSPACASFDLFEDFEDRGRKFKRAVKSL